MARIRSTVKKPNSRKATALVESAINAIIQSQLSESKASIDIMKIGELFSLAMLAYTRDTTSEYVAVERTAREIREWIRVNCDVTHPDELPVLTAPPAHIALTPEEITDQRCGACGNIGPELKEIGIDPAEVGPLPCHVCDGKGSVTNPALIAAREAGLPVWSGARVGDVGLFPAVGAKVTVKINDIGAATVLGYFVEHGFVGLYVKPDAPPEWYLKQNGNTPAHVFGVEIESVSS